MDHRNVSQLYADFKPNMGLIVIFTQVTDGPEHLNGTKALMTLTPDQAIRFGNNLAAIGILNGGKLDEDLAL